MGGRNAPYRAVEVHAASWMAAIVMCLAIATWTPAHAISISENVRPDFFTTDGAVYAAVRSGNTLYIGGSFSAVGPSSGGFIPVDAATGSVPAVFPKVGGAVYASASDGAGGWYIGGPFKTVGGQFRNGLAHIQSDGSVAPWNPLPNSDVYALAIADGILYAGGYFTTIDGQSRNHLAAFDLASGALLPWNPNVNYPVNVLVGTGGKLYMSGSFWTVDGVTRNGLACFDSPIGSLTSWNPNASSFASFYNLVVSGSTVYVSGVFSSIGGQARTTTAALDATTGALLPWNPAPNASIATLAVQSGTVYVGGSFSSIGGQPRNRVAALDAVTGSATAWNPGADGDVRSLVPTATAVYAGGWFTNIGGQARSRLAALDPTTGLVLPWSPPVSVLAVDRLALTGNTLCVCASGCLNPQPRQNLAAIDIPTGVVTSWNPGANEAVTSMVRDGGTLYAGGSFTIAGGQARSYLAAFDVTTGGLTSWNPSPNSYVRMMTRNASRLYVGGSFTQIGGVARSNLAAFDLATGALNAFSSGVTSAPLAIAASDDRVFVATTYCQHAMGTCFYPLVMNGFDATTGVNTGWSTTVTSTSSQNTPDIVLLTQGDQLIMGGSTLHDPSGRYNLIAVSQATGAPTAWNPAFSSSSSVTALARSEHAIFVAGNYSSIGGQSRKGLAALDPTTAEVLPWNPSGGGGSVLDATDSSMFVGGSFEAFGPTAQRVLAAFGDPAPIADAYLEAPASIVMSAGAGSPPASGLVSILGVGDSPGATPGLRAQLGYGPDGSDPATPAWNWFSASYSSDVGGSDRFIGAFSPIGSGEYDYCFRYSYYGGAWQYADLDGSGNGYSPAQAGALTVTPPLSVSSSIREIALVLSGSNPIRGDARFRIDLPAAARVRLCIHDVGGRRVARLVDGVRSAGSHEATWPARERSGVAPGVYYARMTVGTRAIVTRFVLLR